MTTTNRTTTFSLAALLLVVGAPLASAETPWARTLRPTTLEEGRNDLLKVAARAGTSDDAVDHLLARDVASTSQDTGCPGLDVDVFNASDHVIWDIEVKIDQKLGTKTSNAILHLPYLPAKSETRITVECLENYTTHYGGYGGYGGYNNYGLDNSDPISFENYASATLDVGEALAHMIKTRVDVDLTTPLSKPEAGSLTLMDVALATDDPAVAHALVLAIAKSGVGSKELGEAIAKTAEGVLGDEVAKSLQQLPAPQQAQLARSLLAAPSATQWEDSLGKMIDTKLCSGNRVDAVALWMMAQSDDAIPVEGLRARARKACTLLPTDGAALVAAIDQQPRYAQALDHVDVPMFMTVVAAWKKAKGPDPSPSLWAFLANTNDAARFDLAIALVKKADTADAIVAIAEGKPPTGAAAEATAAAEHRAAWIKDAASKLDLNGQDELVRDIFGKLVDGHITDPAMRKAVRGLHDLAPQAADGVVTAFVQTTSKVYDANKLTDLKVDLYDFLAFAADNLADCKSTLEALTQCAKAIAQRPDLVKANAALLSDFLSVADQLMSSAPKEKMVAAAPILDKAGISVKTEVDSLCSSVRDALHWNTDYETPLAMVKLMPGGEACIASIGDEAASKHRMVIIMTVLAILGLVLPFPAGGYFIKRRWKKFQASVPAAAAAPAPGARVEDRLGSAGLGNALGGAVGEARREIDLPGLAVVDQALIERAAATVRRSVKTGDAASMLAKVGGQAIYVLALPVRSARPQIVQRYLGTEWAEHLDAVTLAAAAPVTALVVLCDPGATEATLLVGYSDGAGRRSDPDALLDAKEAREANANTFRGAMSLRVAGAPAPAQGAK